MNNFEIDILWKRVVNDLKENINNIIIYEHLINNSVSVEKPKNFIIETTNLIEKYLKENCFEELSKYINKHFQNEYNIIFKSLTNFNKENILDKKTIEYKNISLVNSKLNFENLIEHDGNLDAIFLAKKIVSTTINLTNIAIFYGDVGCGKTHLANAIVNEYIKNNSIDCVLYTTWSSFASEYYDFFGTNEINVDQFVKKFEKYKLLIIDDFQNFQDRENVFKVFFSVLELLTKNNCQIVFVMHDSPDDLQIFDEAIKSRIQYGIQKCLKRPDLKAMKKILENFVKLYNSNIKFADNAFDYLTNLVGSDVRVALGKMNNILFTLGNSTHLSMITKTQLEQIVKDLKLFKDFKSNKNDVFIKFENIIKTLNFNLTELKSSSRKKNIVENRNLCCYIFKICKIGTYKKIGEFFNRNHSTIINSFTSIENNIKLSNSFKEYVNQSIKKIGLEKKD